MQTKKLGFTDLELTRVGLGTWAIGGPWQFGWGPQNDDDAKAAIREALDIGINWIDTAPIYGMGHSEKLIAEVLKETAQKPIIATKCGLRWNDKRQKVNNLSKNSILEECDQSLKRMEIDHIDLYQLHWPEPDQQVEEAWEAMTLLVKQGKVRYLGASNFDIHQLDRIQKIHPVAALQPPYSMVHRGVEKELLGWCEKHNAGVVGYSPMQRGLLTGKFSHERLDSLPKDDHRRFSPDFKEPTFSASLELVEELKKIADNHNRPVAQLAIAWILRRPEITAAIVGARKPGQIKETGPAADWQLSDDEIEQIENLLQKRIEKIDKARA